MSGGPVIVPGRNHFRYRNAQAGFGENRFHLLPGETAGLGLSGPKDLLHRLSFGQFVDQFIEVANFPHGWFLDVFYADAANDAFDLGAGRIQAGSFLEESLEILFGLHLAFQLALIIPGEPADDGIDFGPGASLLFGLGDVEGIDAGKAGGENTMFGAHENSGHFSRLLLTAKLESKFPSLWIPTDCNGLLRLYSPWGVA